MNEVKISFQGIISYGHFCFMENKSILITKINGNGYNLLLVESPAGSIPIHNGCIAESCCTLLRFMVEVDLPHFISILK